MFQFLRKVGKILKYVPSPLRQFIFESTANYSNSFSLAIRYTILSSYVKYIGSRVYVGRNVSIKNPENLYIGNSVSIHDNCYIDAYGDITIKDNVSIAHNSSIMSFDHSWDDEDTPIKYNPSIKKKVEILEDVWIGAGCRILGGTRINSRVIVAAGAVTKGTLDRKTIYGGIPAKKIKEL